MRVPWLADVLRAAGLNVREQIGWKELRPTYNLLTLSGSPTTLQGVVVHHTASPSTSTLQTNLNVVTNGNGVAPGPIAQLLLWRDGTFHCIAAGKANHAGAGGPWSNWLPAGTANDRTIGIEAVNNGIGEPWAPQMVDAYVRGVAAILGYLGLPASRVLTHNEWTPSRKIDPAGPTGRMVAMKPNSLTWQGDSFRALVTERMTPQVAVPQPFGDDMPDQLYRKQGKAAVWKGDRISRTHVNSEQSLNQLIPKYGPVVLLDETADLAASVGAIVVGNDPGDV